MFSNFIFCSIASSLQSLSEEGDIKGKEREGERLGGFLFLRPSEKRDRVETGEGRGRAGKVRQWRDCVERRNTGGCVSA